MAAHIGGICSRQMGTSLWAPQQHSTHEWNIPPGTNSSACVDAASSVTCLTCRLQTDDGPVERASDHLPPPNAASEMRARRGAIFVCRRLRADRFICSRQNAEFYVFMDVSACTRRHRNCCVQHWGR